MSENALLVSWGGAQSDGAGGPALCRFGLGRAGLGRPVLRGAASLGLGGEGAVPSLEGSARVAPPRLGAGGAGLPLPAEGRGVARAALKAMGQAGLRSAALGWARLVAGFRPLEN